MEDTLFEDKRPILKCSICDFEVKSVPSMENHLLTVDGLKLKLEIIDSNDTETPVPKVVQTTELGETLTQINDLGFSINEAINNENQSVKSNHHVSGNTAHTEMEAKNEKSIGLLRSFRMNKPKKNITNLNQNISDELTAYPGRDHDHKSQPPAEKSKDIGVSAKDIRQRYRAEVGFRTERPGSGQQQKVLLKNSVDEVINSLSLNPCAPDNEDLNTPYQCVFCKKTIKGSVMLQAHQYQEHYDNPNIGLLGDVGDKHVCRVCLKLFTCNSDVKDHILQVHCSDRRYPCTMCGKRFKESTHLRKHLKTHTGKFPTKLMKLSCPFETKKHFSNCWITYHSMNSRY